MAPYYNRNLNVLMISYIIPLYLEDGEFVGVIGMDIDFKTILNEAQEMQIYESGSVAMVNLKDRLIYYSDSTDMIRSEKLSTTLYNHITTLNKFSELLEITDTDGKTSVICCKKLFNGMMIYINVPEREINRERNRLMLICILVTVFIFCLTACVTMKHTSFIIYPIERLTEITKQYAEGDWSGQYISDTGDEVQKLSEGIARMAKNTQVYIERLNNLARTDALTGIRNRTGYLEQIEYIKQNKKEQFNEYAVVVMDLNYLKMINDTYGHEYGDMLIKEASACICRTFEHSPVFRIGGDEFVAVLCAEDFVNRDRLLRQFAKETDRPLKDFPEIHLSVSFGTAEYPADAGDYEEVFELADERMYQNKKQMKMERQD